VNAVERRAIYERDNGLCGFCGRPVPFEAMHLDHIHPRGLGGSNGAANLRPAHRACNIAGGKRVVREHRRSAPIATQWAVRGLDPDLWRELRVESVRRGVPIGVLLNAIIRAWLDNPAPPVVP
jgi:hypothetical protein